MRKKVKRDPKVARLPCAGFRNVPISFVFYWKRACELHCKPASDEPAPRRLPQYPSDSIPVTRRTRCAGRHGYTGQFIQLKNMGNRSTLYSEDIFALPVEHGIALPVHKRGKNDRAWSLSMPGPTSNLPSAVLDRGISDMRFLSREELLATWRA